MGDKQKVIFEMETADPDDFMTLLWLADHPNVDLLAVMVTPGSYDQCQLVRWALDECNCLDTPIGALHGTDWWKTNDGKKPRVSGFHYKVYGEEIKLHYAALSVFRVEDIINNVWNADATYIVGSPPKCLGAAFRLEPDLKLKHWVQQGGFAGDNLVAEADRLDKFKGRVTCPSFNPGGAHKQTLELLANKNVRRKTFVSKNVCHGVVWDTALQEQFELKALLNGAQARWGPAHADIRAGLRMMIHGLDRYLADKGKAKAMHDLVAATCALDDRVCRWSPEVEIYREKGEWGARPKNGTRTRISIGFEIDTFIEVIAQ